MIKHQPNHIVGNINHESSQDFAANLLQILELVEQKLGQETRNKWFEKLEIFSFSSSEIILQAPSKFVRDWIIREFIEDKKSKKNLLPILQETWPTLKKVAVILNANPSKTSETQVQETQTSNPAQVLNLSPNNNVFAFGTELNSKYTFDNFVSAKYNKLAVSMAKIAAGVDNQINLFEDKIPLFIHGNVGMGKTHLAQAIAWKIKEFHRNKKVVYLSAEKFMYHFVQSIRKNDIMSFKEKMRSIDVLIVDDVQFIAGKDSTQQEFMNSFNYLVEENKQVVLVCDRNPNELENIDEKLKSRITGGMVVNFKNPDFNDRLEILRQKAAQLNQEICDKVLNFIAEKINTSVRDLEGALKKLVAAKVFLDEEINLESAKTILADYVKKSNNALPNIDKIQKAVANFFEIKISDLLSSNRARNIARPRQIAMFLAKEMTNESLPKIGKAFGNKNHATVIHSVKLVLELMNQDQNIAVQINNLREKILNKN